MRALRPVVVGVGVGELVLDPIIARERVRRKEFAPERFQVLRVLPQPLGRLVEQAFGAVQVHDVVQPFLQVRVGEHDVSGHAAVYPVGDLAESAAHVAAQEYGCVVHLAYDGLRALGGEVVGQVEEAAVVDDPEQRLHVVRERVGLRRAGKDFGRHECPGALYVHVRSASSSRD